MVTTSEFIVVRTGVEMLIWSENGSVHACYLVDCEVQFVFLFSWQNSCKAATAS